MHRLQAIKMGLHAAACLAHADSNETTCYAIRETPKGKKEGASYKCPRSRSAREGGLGYSLLVCVILPCGPNQVGSTSGPPLRRPAHAMMPRSRLWPDPRRTPQGRGVRASVWESARCWKKTKQKTPASGYRCRCRCSRQSCLALLQLRASPKHYLV